MGQAIEIEGTEIVDDSIIVTMNRSLTSQVGEGYNSAEDTRDNDSFGARLAVALFELDASIDRVYVASNTVVVKRSAGWDDPAVASMSGAIEDLFLFYRAV